MQITSLSKGRFNRYWQQHQQAVEQLLHSCKIGQLTLQAGEPILSQGQRVENLMLVENGFVSLSYSCKSGKRFQLGGMQCNGQLFGEMEFFTEYSCQLDIIAENSLSVIIISGDLLEKALLKEPKLALFFSSAIAIDYQDTLDTMLCRTLYPIAYNIAYELYNDYCQANILMPLSKQYREAERFGTTDRVYRRALKELEANGLIRIEKNQIMMTDIAKIKNYLFENEQLIE